MKIYLTKWPFVRGILERTATRIVQGTAYYMENGEEKWVHRKGIAWHDSYESAAHYVAGLAKRKLHDMNKKMDKEYPGWQAVPLD